MTAAELAERQADFDRELSQRAEDREHLTQRLRETKADLDDVCRAYESASADVDRLTHREAELTSQLTGAHTDLADRQEHFDRELSLAVAERDRVTQTLRDTEVTPIRHNATTSRLRPISSA
jgi:chromosome segregation ATPase